MTLKWEVIVLRAMRPENEIFVKCLIKILLLVRRCFLDIYNTDWIAILNWCRHYVHRFLITFILGEWLAQLAEHSPINLLAFASVGSSLLGSCHFVSLDKILNYQCLQWAEEFLQCIFTDICGLLPELVFGMVLLQVLRFPPHSYQANG